MCVCVCVCTYVFEILYRVSKNIVQITNELIHHNLNSKTLERTVIQSCQKSNMCIQNTYL